MHAIFAQAADTVTTTTTVYQWNNIPMIVGLFFAVAGAFFIGIYVLRRRK